jgi:transposase-like protein
MGLGEDGHMRFPRRVSRGIRDENGKRISLFKRMAMKEKLGIIPKGYKKLTKRHKKVARAVVDGMSVKDVCKKYGVDVNTYYRWNRYHKLFQQYYLAYAERVSGLNQARLDAKVGRAVQIVEESMESADPYFKHDVAHKHLVGTGFYKKHGEVNKKVNMVAKIDSTVEHTGKPLDRELVSLFVEAMAGMASGQKRIQPKFIDVTEVKLLPGSSAIGLNSKDEEIDQAKAG